MAFPTINPETMDPIVKDLRAYLRDSKGLNTLLCDKEEHTKDQLELAVKMGLGAFNMVAPFSSYTLESMPAVAYVFLIHEAVIEALIMASILHSRNQLSYSDGGVTVADHAKQQSYAALMNVITSLRGLLAKEKDYKIRLNIESCYGSIDSEFQSDSLNYREIY